MRKPPVPVYSVHATTLGDAPLYYVSHREAMRLLDEGRAIRVSRRRDTLKVQLTAPWRYARWSPTAVTAREVYVMCGIEGGRSARKAVRVKVEQWKIRPTN